MGMIKLLMWRLYIYPFSLFFCLRYLPFRQAIKIPILIHPSTKIAELHRGSIVFTCQVKRSLVTIGFLGSKGRDYQKTYLYIEQGGVLQFGGSAVISRGTKFVALEGGKISIGNNFFCNANCFFNCSDNISIGNENMYGWEVKFSDSDGHWIFENGVRKPKTGKILTGDKVWIASYSNISKFTEIADGCVVAQNSLVNKKFSVKNTLIAGIPAHVVKENISWKAEDDLKDKTK